MLCQDCGEKVATVLYTQIVQNTKQVMHLCHSCAAHKGFPVVQPEGMAAPPEATTSRLEADVFSGIETVESAQCPLCGLTYPHFQRLGKLGCSQCYSVFAPQLRHLLRKIHGKEYHVGKIPASEGQMIIKRKMVQLRRNLKKAVACEEYEQAAVLRDRINVLEKQLVTVGRVARSTQEAG